MFYSVMIFFQFFDNMYAFVVLGLVSSVIGWTNVSEMSYFCELQQLLTRDRKCHPTRPKHVIKNQSSCYIAYGWSSGL